MFTEPDLPSGFVSKDMPVTRSQNQSSQRGRRNLVGARLDPLSRPGPSSMPQPSSGPSSSTGATLARLMPQDRIHVEVRKLMPVSDVDDPSNIYYAFEFNPASVRVYGERHQLGPVTCTCEAFSSRQKVCIHIQVSGHPAPLHVLD